MGLGGGLLARIDALAFSPRAAGLPGASFRRCPGFIATYQSTANPRFSSRLCTPV